ncbi:NADPH:quinone reductase [Metarhizium rileyi]|uniref:Probable quinone oxidoreductase n=1 Tax=Metarhizium rileyi (strain RCEF 4871) TaxID=1649241 RepID=A0A5C6GKG7_METRR|nr:NADPH:quinone reductase [Metarhizium rileyi]
MAPTPTTMKAVEICKTGGIDVLEYKDVPVPTPKEGQVLVKNEYAGVNFIDTYFRSGLYKLNLPMILGSEAAGEVVSHHKDVTGFPPGTKVVYMDSQAYAQYSAVPASKVIAIPGNLTTEQAAAVFLQGLTAWTFIREAADVQPGQWALVHAAAGGVGQLLVQMLKSVGAKVIGTASTQEKLDLAKKLGAEWTVNSKEDVVAKVSEITGGHGVDAIFDGVGAATFDADLKMIALKGHLVSFGNASGPVPDFSILRLGEKNVKLLRPKVYGYVSERKDLEKYSAELFEQVASGKVKIAVHDVYPLKEVGRAHTDIESRKTTGKLLISLE